MAYDFQIALDCAHPHELADWWAEMLGWEVEPSNEDFIREMVAKGYATEDQTTTHKGVLVWREGQAIFHPESKQRFLFQLVPEEKTVKNRMHLDIRMGADKIEAELERLTARRRTLHRGKQGPHEWITIEDPEGNELCLS